MDLAARAQKLINEHDLDWWRTLGPNDQWLCEAGDGCEEHEQHVRELARVTVGDVAYVLAWDPTWGQLVVMELGYQVWFGNVERAVPSERELIAALTALDDAELDAIKNVTELAEDEAFVN